MKDLLLDSTGDIVISNGDCEYVTGIQLVMQKIKTILGTNLGEWQLDVTQGIDFSVILVKNPDYDQILDTVIQGLRQVDETIQITSYSFQTVQRNLIMTFSMTISDVEITMSLGGVQMNGITYIVCATDADTILSFGNASDTVLFDSDTDSTTYRFNM